MDDMTTSAINSILSDDRALQGEAYMRLMAMTEQPVSWAYEVWDDLVGLLVHQNNRVRSIASQLLANLAKSDPEERILRDLPALLAVTRDERTVTARHCLQSLWKIGLVGPQHQVMLMTVLEKRYMDCEPEKNRTMIRGDIIQGLRNLYDVTGDEAIRDRALALISLEEDPRYRKKYVRIW